MALWLCFGTQDLPKEVAPSRGQLQCQHQNTRARPHPKTPAPHHRDPRTARSHRPSAPELTFGSVASFPWEDTRIAGTGLGMASPAPSSPGLCQRNPACRDVPGCSGMLRDAQGCSGMQVSGVAALVTSKPWVATGGPICGAQAPAAVPMALLSLAVCCILEMVEHRGAGRREGAGGQVFLHPQLRGAGNKGAIELQPLWSVKQKPLVSTSLPLI